MFVITDDRADLEIIGQVEEVAGMFLGVLRGGPRLVDDENARLVTEPDPDVIIERSAADGSTVRFRISGEYEVVDGHERRVYLYDSGEVDSR